MGPRAIGLAAQLKYQFGMPFRKVSNFFQGTFRLSFSPGSIVRSTQKAAEMSSGLISMLRMQLPTEPIVHVDETGWWNAGTRCYLHVFSTSNIILYRVGNRSNQMAIEMLGRNFENILVCDGYAGYDNFQTARCNAHPLRRIRDLMEAMPLKYSDLQVIHDIIAGGVHLSKTRSEFEPSNYASQVRLQISILGNWVDSHLSDKREAVARLAKHLAKYIVEFNRHLFDSLIPTTNNKGERDLRPGVLLRKVGCCNRSDKGIRTFEILASLCATLKSRGMDMLGWLKYRMEGVGPKYIPPELLPEDFGHEIQLC